MKVSLIGISTPTNANVKSPLDVIYTALSQCYNESFTFDDALNTPEDKKNKTVKAVLKSGHDSVSEHVSFTFLIENVSRVLTHQLVRHRIASYSQRSARYTKINSEAEWYVVPKTVKTPEQIKIFTDIMKEEAIAYNKLIELGVPKEDARFVVGDGQCTNIVVTMNCRTLKNFFAERLCTRAHWEIRSLANKMKDLCVEKLPVVFKDCAFGEPRCIQNGGFCTEHMCCGKAPKLKDIIK